MNQNFNIKTILTLLIVAFSSNYYASAQNMEISNTYNDVPTSVALDGNGNIILAGYTKSFDDGSDQAYLIKLDASGIILWEKTMGDIYGDRIFDISVDDDQNICVTGESWLGFGNALGRENLFIARLDKDGGLLAEKSYYAYHRDMGLRLKETTDKNHIVIGYTKSMSDKIGEILILKINQSLDTVWQTVLGEEGSVDYGFDILEDEYGYVLIGTIGGFFNSVQDDYLTPKSKMYLARLGFDGRLVWEKKYGGTGNDWIEQAVLVNDNLYSVGSTQSIGNGSFDMLLFKTDINGDSIFAKSYGDEFYEQGRSIVFAGNRLFLGGQKKKDSELAGSVIYLVCTDLNGQTIWEKTIETSMSDKLIEMALSNNGNSIYCLAQSKHEDTHKDFWLFNMDLDGNISSFSELLYAGKGHVYPNPVSSIAHIGLDNYATKPCEIIIYNEVGQAVSRSQSKPLGNVFSFPTTSLSSGFYTYKLYIGNEKTMSGKFIVH